MYDEHIRATARIREGERDHHLAAHRGIGRLGLHHFDHLLIWYELDEVAVARIGVCGRLAGPGRLGVCERDSEQTTRACVEKLAIDDRTGRLNVATDAG